jgi:osmotically-inducible protein OsmY
MMDRPNFLLESDVKEEFSWDPELDDDRVVVKAEGGRIVLSGVVETFHQFQRAAADAWAVSGVKAVDNELLVGPRGAAIADHDIAAACATALTADKIVPKGSVTAEVKDGFVTLTGQVRRHFQRKAAELVVGRVDGVRGVTDNITLTQEPIPSDVTARIHKAFQRNAIIDDSLMKVSSEGHTIYLDGTTSSNFSKVMAEDTAWNAPGVDEVVNRLTITP